MRSDITQLIVFILIATLFGFAFGYPLIFTTIAAITANIWLLYKAKKLHRWFIHQEEHPESDSGIFYLLHRDIGGILKKNRLQRKTLRKTLQQFRDASNALPDAVVIFDEQGKISWANPLAKTLLGIKFPEDINQRVTNLIRTPAFVEAWAEHQTIAVNIDINTPNQRNQKINLKIIDLAQGSHMLVARDITRLTNINQAQKDFVSNVSHELKTPITVMRGYLEMLDEHPKLDSSLAKPIQDMALQTTRMQNTIDDLLYLSKLESTPNDPENKHQTVSIRGIVDMIMDTARPLAEQNQQALTFELDNSTNIEGNANELQIAFNNLVINAIRYTPEHGKIKIKWFYRPEDNTAVFSVTDNGAGIAPNHIARLTERFYRVDQGRSREKGGTGLGLAIVKNVLDRHDATLNIQSSLGSGSCFECIFKLDQQ